MIRTISPQDMREMERAFLEGTGYPSILLMEHAAQAVVDALSAYAKAGSRVAVRLRERQQRRRRLRSTAALALDAARRTGGRMAAQRARRR
ncbi:MAG: hypothetical protein ACLUHE_00505 [Christensenellales bacterium]